MEPTDRIRDLIHVGEQLCKLIARENDALRKHDRDFVAAHVEEKTTLSHAYEKLFRAVTEDGETLADAREAYRDQLLDLGQRLDELMAENGILLEAAVQSGRMVLDVVAEAVRKAQPDAGTYSAGGRVDRSGKSNKSSASVAVDETL